MLVYDKDFGVFLSEKDPISQRTRNKLILGLLKFCAVLNFNKLTFSVKRYRIANDLFLIGKNMEHIALL